ncbi:3'-5' exoribonuclease domain-containing protein [Mycolicibacterium mucogenicum]|uniref:3'-5' exoribonuclease n=1 Tax=Mycolicibacterium mucogenicum DSM 44124 TaxID=1226753 RepID=A0A8H2J9G6_MYCMU|nr:3'-5' exoribonuclease [Mycolicibacterium mucogenicum]KAB7761207.1 hypothetical protein MMUC44124_01125 [Mycolicibacterium mucogenicum DSM 44124]QPG70028.1 3'-5' exoribonuclease [Mycolicibacterium mucogenicum DSM 44124]
MTVYCYDTEFLDDGRTIELISIGIVADDGREYYAANSDMQMERIKEPANAWLVRNVLPHLPIVGRAALERYLAHPQGQHPKPSISTVDLDRTSTLVKPKWVIANEVREFLLADGDDVELWAYYAAYDHVALAQLWGPMMNLPKGIPMWTHDLMQLLEQLSDGFVMPEQVGDEHHALADARWNRQVYDAAWSRVRGEPEMPF